jgi:hypothetical protein
LIVPMLFFAQSANCCTYGITARIPSAKGVRELNRKLTDRRQQRSDRPEQVAQRRTEIHQPRGCLIDPVGETVKQDTERVAERGTQRMATSTTDPRTCRAR